MSTSPESMVASPLADDSDYERVERAARRKLIIGAAVPVLLAAGCLGGLIWKHLARPLAVDAKIGQCLTSTDAAGYNENNFLIAECDAENAAYRVLGMVVAPAIYGEPALVDRPNVCERYPDTAVALFLNSERLGNGNVRVLCLEDLARTTE
jgi:hypothetical protein